MKETAKPGSGRLDKLRELHRADPSDSFIAYGLAMELAKTPATEPEAVAVFRKLLAGKPDYIPTYFQLGTLLGRRGEAAAAREVLSRGIAAARAAGESHTAEELEAALAGLG